MQPKSTTITGHENQPIPLPQPMKINPHSGDVLAHLPGKHGEVVTPAEERVQQGFEREQVHLFVVGSEGRAARVVGVLHGGAAVGVEVDAEVGEEVDAGLGGFGEGVGGGEVRCVDGHVWGRGRGGEFGGGGESRGVVWCGVVWRGLSRGMMWDLGKRLWLRSGGRCGRMR